MNTRRVWLALALAATLAAVWWPLPEDEGATVVPAREVARAGARESSTGTPTVVATPESGARLAAMQADLFPQQTWQPPPPPPKPYVPPPPPPPQAPPLPFRHLGHWDENGQQTLLLVQGEQPVAVRPGQTLPGGWRVDTISEHAVVFTYLPLGLQTTLGITR